MVIDSREFGSRGREARGTEGETSLANITTIFIKLDKPVTSCPIFHFMII